MWLRIEGCKQFYEDVTENRIHLEYFLRKNYFIFFTARVITMIELDLERGCVDRPAPGFE